MTIHYLDVDDEVTTAVARLRTAGEPYVALVLPAGSRVATSRINFRLLAREAAARERRLAIVSPETAVRAISIAAGVPAYATVAAYEEALADDLARQDRERLGPPGGESAAGGSAAGEAAGRVSAAEAGETGAPQRPDASGSRLPAQQGRAGAVPGRPQPATMGDAAASQAGPRSAGALPVGGHVREAPSRRRPWRVAVVALVVVLLAAGGAGAYLVLPSAQIVVTPVGVTEGPISLQVTADPSASAVDAANLVIPAQQVSVPLSAQGTFPATGQKVNLTPATGTVVFTSNDTIGPVKIPAGTTVGTSDGVQFLTSSTVITPRATVSGTTITPGRASTAVTAVAPGPAGNVPAHAIALLPTQLQAFQVSVDNPAATSGGTRSVTKVVSQQDYDAAVQQLTTRIDAQLGSAATNPVAAPAGSTLIAATAARGAVAAAPSAAALVGSATSSFQLTATATATVLAVSQQLLAGLAASYLQQHLPAGWSLFPDSIRTTVSNASVQGGHVTFTVTAQAERWHPLDAAALLAQVKGRSVADARAILQQYGEVSITTWPSFVTTIPTLDARVSLTVAPPKRAGT
jgi:hypothetical protein